jgi:hypothetical protein
MAVSKTNTTTTTKPKPPVRAEQETAASSTPKLKELVTKVYCTLCTRTVDANVSVTVNTIGKRRLGVRPGQKCRHCGGSLDAAYVLGNLS